jgi:hypothetical protein
MAKSIKDAVKSHTSQRKKQTFQVKYISINDITKDLGIQSRVTIDQEVVSEYTELMQNNTVFPPIVVFKDSENNILIADGFHRYEAAKLANKTEIECEIHEGTKRDAIEFSIGANATHGLRRTNADKRKAVLMLLQDAEWSAMSNRAIGSKAGVDHKTVGNIREEYNLQTEKVIGSDGKEYKNSSPGEIPHVKKERTKFYRFKMDLEYKEEMEYFKKNSQKNEKALLKEAFEYLRGKYGEGE